MPINAGELWPGDPARQVRWEQIMAWLAPNAGESVLDIGCGGGEAVAFVAERVGPSGHAIGLERSAASVAKLCARYPVIELPALSFQSGEAEALPFADESFAAVLCVNVLEAILDRPRALAEMLRVLKPDGRILLAHDDYESQAYAGADRDLTRRAVSAYANSTFKSYPTSDGQMGRQLWSLFASAGFLEPEVRVLPLVNTKYREPFFGWVHAQFTADFVATVSDLTQAEIDRWHRELAAASQRGTYFYCVNLYVCLGRKPHQVNSWS